MGWKIGWLFTPLSVWHVIQCTFTSLAEGSGQPLVQSKKACMNTKKHSQARTFPTDTITSSHGRDLDPKAPLLPLGQVSTSPWLKWRADAVIACGTAGCSQGRGCPLLGAKNQLKTGYTLEKSEGTESLPVWGLEIREGSHTTELQNGTKRSNKMFLIRQEIKINFLAQHRTELPPVITGRGVSQTAQPLGISRQRFPRETVRLKGIANGLAQAETLQYTLHSSPAPLKQEACADFCVMARTAQPHEPFPAAPLA